MSRVALGWAVGIFGLRLDQFLLWLILHSWCECCIALVCGVHALHVFPSEWCNFGENLVRAGWKISRYYQYKQQKPWQTQYLQMVSDNGINKEKKMLQEIVGCFVIVLYLRCIVWKGEFLQPVTGVFTKEDMIQVWTHKQLGVTRSSIFRQEEQVRERGGFWGTRTQALLCYNRDSRLCPVGSGSPLKGLIRVSNTVCIFNLTN